jgi:hypothetical protein
MQRPDVRSTNRDKPTHPSMPSSAGITLSRVCAMPASMDEGCPWIVVLRAYIFCLRCMWGSVSTAPPDYFIVLPRARHGNGWRSQSDGNSDSLKPAARPNNTRFTIKRS